MFLINKIPSSISFLGKTSVATIPTLFDFVNKNAMEGFELKENRLTLLLLFEREWIAML